MANNDTCRPVEHVGDIDARLRELGFDLVRINGSHRIYKHYETGRGIGYAPSTGAGKIDPVSLKDLHRKLAEQGYESGWFPPARERVQEIPMPPTPVVAAQYDGKILQQIAEGVTQAVNGQNGQSTPATAATEAEIDPTSEPIPGVSKRCSRCHVTKAVSAFNKSAGHRGGLYPCCKQCRREYSSGTRASGVVSASVIPVVADGAGVEVIVPPRAQIVPPAELDLAPASVPANDWTLGAWLESHPAVDGPSAFMSEDGRFLVLVLHTSTAEAEAWVLTLDGDSPPAAVDPGILDWVVRRLMGVGKGVKIAGKVYY